MKVIMATSCFLVASQSLAQSAEEYILNNNNDIIKDSDGQVKSINTVHFTSSLKEQHTVLEMALQACRRLNGLPKWNMLHLSEADALRAIQLCIGEARKQECGEFCVQVSDVLAVHQRLVNNALYGNSRSNQPQSSGESESGIAYQSQQKRATWHGDLDDQQTAACTPSNKQKHKVTTDHLLADVAAYSRYLLESRLLDSTDLLATLRRLAEEGKYIPPETPTLIVGYPSSALEREMAAVLFGPQVVAINATEGAESKEQGLEHEDTVWYCVEVRPLKEQSSRSGQHFTNMLVSLLRLLVNTRDELALAAVCQMPGLDISAADFLAIRRAARAANAPMYQMAVSHVRRADLGRSDPQLAGSLPALRRLVNVLQNMQDVLEEEPDAKLCCLRLVSVAKACLLRGGGVRPAQATEACQRLRQNVLDVCQQYLDQRDPAVIGGHAVKLVRDVVDRISCSSTPVVDHISVLDDAVGTPGTPGRSALKLPSIVSLFKSPTQLESEDEEEADVSLRDRLENRAAATDPAATPTSSRSGAGSAAPSWLPAGQTPPEGVASVGSQQQAPTPHLVAGPTLVCSRSGSRPEKAELKYKPGAGVRAYRELQAADRAKRKESQLISPKTAKESGKQPKRSLFHVNGRSDKDTSAASKGSNKRKTEAAEDQENLPVLPKMKPSVGKKAKQIKQVAGQKSIRDFFHL